MTVEDTRAALRSAGLSATPHRLWVLALLEHAGRALSAPEILERAQSEQAMNKVTLYRILDLLAAKGLVAKSLGHDRSALYCLGERRTETAHGHFHCSGCGRALCLEIGAPALDLAALRASLPMRLDEISLNLFGRCPACLERDAWHGAGEDS